MKRKKDIENLKKIEVYRNQMPKNQKIIDVYKTSAKKLKNKIKSLKSQINFI